MSLVGCKVYKDKTLFLSFFPFISSLIAEKENKSFRKERMIHVFIIDDNSLREATCIQRQ